MVRDTTDHVEGFAIAHALGVFFGSATNHPVNFTTNNGGARMTLATDGNVGIGTSGPNQKLTVDGIVAVWNGNQINFYTDAGTTLKGYVGAGRNNDAALVSKTAGNWLRLGANNGHIAFFPDNTGDSGDTPKCYIDTDGAYFVGTRRAIDGSGRALYAA